MHESRSTGDPAAEVAQLVDRLDRLVRSAESGQGLNPAQWEALRYLARANRFSRTPAALAEYLCSTRGTVSQTLIALEQKGHVVRTQSPRDKRSVDLALTDIGRATLNDDPLNALAADIAAAQNADIEGTALLLRETLLRAIRRNGSRPFGVCRTCRHFRPGVDDGMARCALLDEPLDDDDSAAICVEQEPAASER